MIEIIARDINDNAIAGVVQWDRDVRIYLSDKGISQPYQVHMFNNFSKEALVVNTEFKDGKLCAKIPNDLLIQPLPIIGFVNVTENGEARCTYCFKINMRKKPKPSDYVHKDSNDYVSVGEIRDECKKYAEEATKAAEQASENASKAEESAHSAEQSKKDAETEADRSEKAADRAETAAQQAESAKINVVQTTGESTTDVMSQKAVTDALNEHKGVNVVQITGESTEDVMSQKAVTNELNNLDKKIEDSKVNVVKSTGASEMDVMSQKAVTDKFEELDNKVEEYKVNVVQTRGESTEDVMSQNAVTEDLSKLEQADVGRKSSFDATSEIFNSYDGEDANAAGTELEEEQTPFYAHAEGYGNSALAKGSHAEGHGNTIENGCDNSHAEGDGNSITQGSANCHAEGSGNEISQSCRNCHAEGNGNSISQGGQNGHLCGTGNTMEGSSQNSFANGKQNHLKDGAQNSFINGETNTIEQGSKNSLVNGWTNSLGGASQQALVSGASSTYTNINNSICAGYANNVIGWNISSPTDGACLAVFGYYITAQSVGGSLITGASSTVKNSKFVVCCGVSNSVLSANHSTALGKDNSIDYSLTNRTQGDAVCTVIGYWNNIKGAYECLAIGGFNNIKPELDDDVATGDSPMNSIALGRDNDLIGHLDDVIAIGNANKVTHSSDGVIIGTSNELKSDSKSNPKGDNYALGYRNIITNGNHCYSFGYDNEIAEGVFDLIAGIGLKTDGTPNPFPQTVYGAYNEPVQAALLIIGAGRDDGNRKNALYIDPNGIIHIQQQTIFEGEIVPNGGISGYATKEDIAQIAGNSTFVSVSYADGAINVTEDSGVNVVTKSFADEEAFILYDGTNRNKGYTAHFTWTNAEHSKNAEIIGFVRPTGTVVVFNGVISELGSDIVLYADDGKEIGTISIDEDRVLSLNFTGDRTSLKMEGYITTFRQG